MGDGLDGFQFFGGRWAFEDELEDSVDGGLGGFFLGAFGDEFGLFDDEGAVEEVEGLKGGGGDGALGADLTAVGEVESGEDLVIDAAHALLVDQATPGVGSVVVDDLPLGVGLFDVVNAEATAADFGVQFAGSLEDAVADDFGFDAAGRKAPEEGGAGVFLQAQTVGEAGAAEGVGHHDLADHGFGGPALTQIFGGEPVEELGVGGFGSGDAEVGGGGDDAGSEEVVPDAVDHDPGGERVVG